MRIHQPVTLEIYVDDDKQSPFLEWLNSLDKAMRYRIKERLDRISLGNFGDHKLIEQGISEFRFNFGPGYRIYYGNRENTIVLLLCGGDKKSQKKDIKKAILYWKAYLSGVENE